MICFQILPFMVMWVSHKCALLVAMVAYVLCWVKMEYFEFLILWYNVEHTQVCQHILDGLALSCFLWSIWKINECRICCEDVVVLQVLLYFCVCTYTFRHSVVDSLVMFLFVVLYWYVFTRHIHKISCVCRYCHCNAAVTMVSMCA
jgi:hypothetical protein